MAYTRIVLFAALLLSVIACEKEGIDATTTSTAVLRDAIEPQPISLYQFQGNVLTKLMDYPVADELMAYQDDRSRHEQMWKAVRQMFPPLIKNYIAQFEVHYTKGAFLIETEPLIDNNQWKVMVSIDLIDGLSDPSKDATYLQSVIKVAGDFLFQNSTQIDLAIPDASCDIWLTSTGCVKAGSMLSEYIETFWEPLKNGYEEAVAQNQLDQFFHNHRDQFLSQEAATGPLSDLRETFANFTISEAKPAVMNNGLTSKVIFMYEQPLLLEIKTYMRQQYLKLLSN